MKNRYYDQVQNMIGAIGDHIGDEHRLLAFLVKIRGLSESQVVGQEAAVLELLEEVKGIIHSPNIPKGSLTLADKDVEGRGTSSGGTL